MSKDVPTSTSLMPEASYQEGQILKQKLPQMTVGTSEDYLEKLASLVSHAMLPNPMWARFFTEGTDTSEEQVVKNYHCVVKDYIGPRLASGAFIAEAGDFSASSCWFPPGSHESPKELEDIDETGQDGMALLAAFGRESDKTMTELIWSKYGQGFWQLVLLGRDPRKSSVPGAVRAVLKPFIDQAAAEGKPIWLVTSNEKAKDIYLHYGWQMVRAVTIQGYTEWCMIRYPPPQGK